MQPQEFALKDIVQQIRCQDFLSFPLATGQPMAFLMALSQRDDWENLKIFTGLLGFPYPFLSKPGVEVVSGYYGPIERHLNESGAKMSYLPANFSGFETYALRQKPRVVATTLSSADADGFHTFGTHGAAVYYPFVSACKNPDQITIAEINDQMPIVYGLPEFGDNKIHSSQLNYYFKTSQTQMEPPITELSEIEKTIAENVAELVFDRATLQFGIGPIPDHVATLLAHGVRGDFGVHSEMVSDGFFKLFEAGKISNRHKGIFENSSIFTFALGSKALYDFLDERQKRNRRRTLCLPVSVVNNPYWIAKNKNFVSINSGLIVDFAGQVCSEAIGLKQYSGVGGQLSFVQGAYNSPNGISILCIKSTATVNGQKISNIVPVLPEGSLVSTPRHFTQIIVTEYGTADLYGVSDEKRAAKLIQIAHPDFRDELTARFEEIKNRYYH